MAGRRKGWGGSGGGTLPRRGSVVLRFLGGIAWVACFLFFLLGEAVVAGGCGASPGRSGTLGWTWGASSYRTDGCGPWGAPLSWGPGVCRLVFFRPLGWCMERVCVRARGACTCMCVYGCLSLVFFCLCVSVRVCCVGCGLARRRHADSAVLVGHPSIACRAVPSNTLYEQFFPSSKPTGCKRRYGYILGRARRQHRLGALYRGALAASLRVSKRGGSAHARDARARHRQNPPRRKKCWYGACPRVRPRYTV